MRKVSLITDVSSDLMDGSVEAQIEIDPAARLGVSAQAIDQALYDSFGQRLVSTIYREMNQYHVVMGLDPSQAGNPATLDQIYVTPGHGSELVPLSAIARWSVQKTSLSQSHQGQFPAVTLSYLSPGASLGPAQRDTAGGRCAAPGPRHRRGALQAMPRPSPTRSRRCRC